MHVFIAGGTGVLGRRVVRRLLDHGHRVACLARSSVNRVQLLEMGAEPREGDLFRPSEIEAATRGCDAIIHLASAVPTHFPSKLSDWKLNDRIRTTGTESLVCAAIANRCRVLVAQSITSVYGDCHGAWVDETSPRAVNLNGILRSAVEMEQMLDDARRRSNLPAVTLRFGTFYGHDDAHTQQLFELIDQGKFPILGDGETWWNMVQLDDAARAVVAVVEDHERHLGEKFNIVDGQPVHMEGFVSGLAELLEARKPWHVPIWLARLRMGASLLEPLLLSMRCSNDKARKKLRWEPRYPDFRYGFQAALNAWRRELSEVACV